MFKGKTALVTGSTSGIGLGIAEAFAAAGANIVLNGFGDAVAIEALLAAQPSKRFVQVGEVAALTLHLCSDVAASITGTILPVDGGWTAH